MNSINRVPNKLWRISSIVTTALIVISTITPLTTHTALALDIPQPIYPANYSETTSITDLPLGVPSFSWSEVNGATKYRLQVDNEIGFNTPIVLDLLTSNASYTPAATNHLFADGQWYWRVRVEAPTPVGEWSDIWSFTKTWANLDTKPPLVAPDDQATIAFFDAPIFSWGRVSGAAKYRFQVASSSDGFDTPVYTHDTLTDSHQPSTRLANGTYFWRVIPMDTADHLGTSSDVRSFTLSYGYGSMIPTQLEPANYSYPTFTPTFRWTAVEGAEFYRLEYTSDETCDFGIGTAINTRQTSYTPIDTFPNDKRYCWHVRVESGAGVGEWSDTWYVQKQWYLQPHLLTPTNMYQTGLYPVYSWTPVPGAASYKLEVSQNPSFSSSYLSATTANTTYAPTKAADGYYYWRVTPIDGGGELGMTSEVFEYRSSKFYLAPVQIYPFYYYYTPGEQGYYYDYAMNPYENRTAAYPIFIWHRLLNPPEGGGTHAVAYRIQVDTTPYFTHVDWQSDTENTSVTPTPANNFVPDIGRDYYWRVCPLASLGGACEVNSGTGLPWWSQVWRARFDPTYDAGHPKSWVRPPIQGDSPVLLTPAHGQESVEATPLLEWWSLSGATQYQVEVSRDSDFITHEISVTVDIPAYSPRESLAQRSLGRTDYGSFYWRVRGLVGTGWTNWSDTRRFQIASQSEWRLSRTLGNPANQLLIGDDLSEDASGPYDLTTLYAAQSGASPAHWYFGFNATITETDVMTYVLYIDLDHVDGSGAFKPPLGPVDMVTTIPAHRPEYAVLVENNHGLISAETTWVYAWNSILQDWGFRQRFIDIGGNVYSSLGYIELQIPNAAIGMSQVTSSASVMLFSFNPVTLTVEDSVPPDPQVPGNPELSRFSAVSERMNLIFPPNTNAGDLAAGDVLSMTSMLPFYWDWPTGSSLSTPFTGSTLEAHLDPGYTNLVETLTTTGSDHFGVSHVSGVDDVVGDNIYYWRVKPAYIGGSGAWSGGWSFRRLGFKPLGLTTSITFATPTFSWDMTEGASTYRLQVSTDPNFGSTVINQVTPLTSFTPTSTLIPALYYWRVQVIRYGSVINDWSPHASFDLRLPIPSGLSSNGAMLHYAPTFCWDALVGYDGGNPVLTAWKYRVQVSRDPNFSQVYDTIDTTHNCWTPTKGYLDGDYYWHVAMIDGNSRLGPYSDPTAIFTKQYPITTLISPPNGGSVPEAPTFTWSPVDGAATYVLEVSKFPTFSPLYDSATTINTQFTPTKIYDADTAYYWRVAIKDRDTRQGPFTDATFIIDGPIIGLTATNDSPTELGDLTTLIATITDGSNVSYAWSYGDGEHGSGATTSHTYPAVGTYTAIVTATNTVGSVVATTLVHIVDVPIAGLEATSDSPTELGSVTTLTATVDAGTNVAYSWNFGDGTHGHGPVVTHTYTSVGIFRAVVTASNSRNTLTASTFVTILDIPISGLAAENNSPTIAGDTTWLTATIQTGTHVIYKWDYGDGSSGSGVISSHVYADIGSYTATVTATNPINSMTADTIITIAEEPISGLVAGSDSPTYLGHLTHFTASIAGGTNVSYAWDFGDGSTGSGPAPAHLYGDLGDYTALVTATNSLGSESASMAVSVTEEPISGFEAINDGPTELGSLTTLTANIASGTNVTFEWDFGDSLFGSGAVATHTYSAVGQYTAVVTATNGAGSAVATTMVSITDIPITGLSAVNDSPMLLGETTTFTATILTGTGVVYHWDFGDGSSADGQITTHLYAAPGNYTTTVTATNSQGFVATTTEVVIIPPEPIYFYVYLPVTVK